MARESRKQLKEEEELQILKIIKWIVSIAIKIIIYHLIVRFVFDYKIVYVDVGDGEEEKGFSLKIFKVEDGYDIYPIKYEKGGSFDIEDFEKNMWWTGYVLQTQKK